MTRENIKRISLDEIIRMKDAGELPPQDPKAEPGPDLPDEFWENAIGVDYRDPTDVTLNLDPLVLAWFKQQDRDHIIHMQDVLKDYMQAEMRRAKSARKHPDAAE